MKFSIVIPTLDRWPMLADAIFSVRRQTKPGAEIIVVDGGSSDRTVEWVRSQADVRLIEGPDRGVYDAINKGIAAARGQWVGILNSDDEYHPQALASVSRHLDAGFASVAGGAGLCEDGRVTARFCPGYRPHDLLVGSSLLNARFFSRGMLEDVGPFRLDLPHVADRDWLMRAYVKGLSGSTLMIPDTLYYYKRHDGSLTFSRKRDETALRRELLRLAREWRTDLDPLIWRAAACLEGRCVAWLAREAASGGRWIDVVRLMVADGKGFSFSPAASLARGGLDWMRR